MNEQGRSTNFAVTDRGTLASGVADAGTFTVSYPARPAPEAGVLDAGAFLGAFFHRLVMNQAVLVYPDDFDLTFGTSSITVTNKTGATWAAGSEHRLQLDLPGKAVWAPNADNQAARLARTARSDGVLVNLGAPDTASSTALCASQSIGAGTSSGTTAATFNGAITASAGVVTFDTPRNVVGAWTTAAVVTVHGKDEYGNTLIEACASGTTFTGVKAFKKITRIWSDTAITSATFGNGDVLGLPVYLPGRGNVIRELLDGKVIGDREPVRVPFTISATDLAAGTTQQLYAPTTGRISRVSTVIQTALSTTATEVGQVWLTVNGALVTASSISSYTTATGGNGSIGDTASTLVPESSGVAAVNAGDAIGVAMSGSWASLGALAGVVEIAPTGSGIYRSGTVVAGLTTGGGSTSTTADVRGTYTPPVACDGSIVVQLLLALPDIHRGATQYAG